MSEIKRVKIDSILESQIPEFLNEEFPLFREFLKQYYYSLEHQSGTLDLVNNLKQYKNIEQFTRESLIENTNLTAPVLSFDATINVDSTAGWPDKYGLLKIDDEIITYLSKTNNSFIDCIRGFSGIDSIVSNENSEFLNFTTTIAEEHSITSKVKNLSNLFLIEFFEKYRFEFFPGFETRELLPELSLPNILTGAKDFYSSKGTDSSYKLLFKILYGKDVEIIKPQDNTLVPSSNVYFITKNILVEKISGAGNPTELPGNFIFQTLPGIGTVSASIFNVEYRPVDSKELYEISLDSTSLDGTFQASGKTKIMEDVEIGSDNILVDSTIGFSDSGVLIIKTETSDLVKINYQDKTVNQFLGVTGVDRFLQFGDDIIEEKFAISFVGSGNTSPINFRVINVIDNIDSSKTSNMRVGDTVKLSGFGKDLSQQVKFNNWIYNIPTKHQITSLVRINTNLYRATLFDEIFVYLNEIITLVDPNNNKINASIVSIEYPSIQSKKTSNVFLIQVQENLFNVNSATTLTKFINKSKHNTNYFPDLDKIPNGVQNTYLSSDNTNMFVTSTGFPNYTISATDNKKIVSTSGVGKTDLFYSLNHPYSTGESIYYKPNGSSGISTGVYQVTKVNNNNFKLSFSKSDIFSKKYVQANSGILNDEVVKFGYQNKTIKNQKLLKRINLIPTPLIEYDDANLRSTTGVNKQIGMLVNGVELFSPTIFDESIYYGKLNSIEVIDSGSGYDVINSPDIEINDFSGSGVKSKLNISGNFQKVKILSPGVGYQEKPKITITGGNGIGCVLESNLVSAKINGFLKGDSGVNVADNEITFDDKILFEDNEQLVYTSNNNLNIPGIISGSTYFIGIVTDNTVKLYNNLEDCVSRVNEINISGISSGVHDFSTLTNKNTISQIYVIDPGKGYSNRSIRVPSILSFDSNTLGINTYDSYIFAKNHGFNTGEIVKYNYTETPISGLSSEFDYYVDVIDPNKFRLASAGVGGTLSNINLINKKYEPLNTLGLGTHIISYPPIQVKIESLSAIGSTTIIEPILKPIVLGSVEDVFLEDGGVSFGSTHILNFHRRPFVGLSSIRSEALLNPIIVNSSIVGVQIINKGLGYREDVDIIIEGPGRFAELEPIVENGSLVGVVVVSGGVGYVKTDTVCRLQNRGAGLELLGNVNEWKINQVVKSKNLISNEDDGLIFPNLNPTLELQFISLYIPKKLRVQLSDNFTQNNTESGGILNHSPILGYAYDGNPIYGPYGYENPLGGPIKRLVSGYISDLNDNLELRPPGFEVGYFVDDYKFIGTGDLDEYNGRFCITPEFPDGIYAYFSTISVNSFGSGPNSPSGTPIPMYPYIIGSRFKDVPILDNFLPKYNQNFNIFNTNLIRNTGPYYLNYSTSGYELLDSISDDYKQELSVESINFSPIEDALIFNRGNNYEVGDIVLLDNEGTGGTSASIDVSRIEGRDVSEFQSVNNIIENVELTIRSNNIIGETSSPHGLLNNQPIQISGVSTITSSNLEGVRLIKINQKEVELVNDIDDILITGGSTKIVVRDISGFEPNDFIGIGTEILQITKISTIESSFSVNRISNVGVHTAGLENVILLPKKFEFRIDGTVSDFTLENKTIFFNPKEDVGTGAGGTTRVVSGIYTSFTRNIPGRSIYIPGHKFFTGQKLIYNSGFGGTSLYVNNVGSGISFILNNDQEVYAVNLGVDYVGLSTIGFTSTTGIGSQFNSLEFQNLNEFFGVIGITHSLTTTNSKITCAIESNFITVTTNQSHGLTTNDLIKLNVSISNEEEVKVIYDFVNRKTALKEVLFTDSNVSVEENTIDISSYNGEINTGDRVVYIAQTPIGGLSHYGIYYVLKNSLNKIKLCKYISDIKPIENINEINTINFNSTGGDDQKFYFINPPLTFFRGNRIKFDVSDPSLLDMDLTFYTDFKLTKKIEVIGSSINGFLITREGIPGNPDSYVYLNTSTADLTRILYYTLVPTGSSDLEKIQISTDDSVVGANHIILVDHSLNSSFKVDVLNSNTFTFVNNKVLTYAESQSLSTANITYDTNSKSALGPISKLKINFKGRGYQKLPTVRTISSKLGTDAIVRLISPTIGRIESFSRVKDGFDYPTDPTLSPLLSVPSVVGIKNIRTIGSVSIISGGKNYNTVPTLVVPQNLKIKLQAIAFGGSIESVKIVTNSTELSGPLEIISTRNSNGFDIDFITVNGNLVTLELLNDDLIDTSFGSGNSSFPFAIGDGIFIEDCRLTASTNFAANFNSEKYGYKFFPVVGVNTNNNTVTYSMSGISTGNFGTYDNTFNLGFVVNKKDMPIFEMNLIDDVNYFSNEIVSTDKFRAVVMEDGWDGKLNQLRLNAGDGDLQVGDKLFGQTSKVNGVIEYFDTFILNSTLGVSRDKVGNVDTSVGILNEFQQRISDNFYYQKFSYSIKGDIPYDIWRESVRSLVHPAGFKEFSDLVIYSEPKQFAYSNDNLKPQILDSTAKLSINIDNEVSMYERYNFTKVYEEDSLEDGSMQKVYIADGLVLTPFIINRTNKVLQIDDISNQFDGTLNISGSVVGLSTFKLKNKGTPLFKHVFGSQSNTIDVVNNKFIIPNHNYQSGQKLIYEYDNSPIGIATTSYVSGITSSIIQVGDLDGTAIFENGYSVAITTSITGISTTLVPAGPNFQQYLSVIGIGTLGIDAEFNVFLTYDVATGVPIGTSIIPNKGGRGYKVGDTVSIAGTFLGGTSPTNDLSFVVSNVTSTSISSESNISYSNVPSFSIIGNGAIFNVQRDVDGFVSNVNVVNGGTGYSSTSIVSIAGTYVGGTSDDIISFSPIELGTKVLPTELYVLKLNDNEFRVAGLSTSVFVDLVGIGSGSHSFAYSDPDPSVMISIDGIIQSSLRRKSLQITLSEPISTGTTTLLSVSSGISSLNVNDILNINDELVVVNTIGIPSSNNVGVSRGYFDSVAGIHTVGAACTVINGDFKIIGDTIYFTTPPYGKIGIVGLETGSNFGGRVFSRRFDPSLPEDKNIILDDISLQFTGLGATQFSLKSDGESIQTLYNNVNSSSFINNNPVILINNVFQESDQKYEIEDENENKLNFIDGVPKAGKIVRVGVTTGFGYQPLLIAAAEVQVSASGTISSVILTGAGGGYRQSPVVSIASTIGSGASITATVGSSGTITGFNIVNPGSGYTSTSIPTVVIGIPTGYSNLPLEYYDNLPGIGEQAKITVEVGMGSSIISFKFDETGVAYKIGDVLVATGITTGPGLRTDILNIIDFTYDNVSGINTITTDIAHNLNIDDNIRISGAAFTCGYDEVGIKTFSYDNITGICTVVTYSPHGLLKTGVPSNQTSDEVFLFNLPFDCAAAHAGVTTTIFPDGTSPYGKVFPVLSKINKTTFTMNSGISTIPHTFVGWPEIGISTFTYDNFSGISTVTTTSDHQLLGNDKVTLSGLAFSCSSYVPNATVSIIGFDYDHISGVTTITTLPDHKAIVGKTVRLSNIELSCSPEHLGVTTTIYPHPGSSPNSASNWDVFTVTGLTTNTFTINSGVSTIPHTYVSGGTAQAGITSSVFPYPGSSPFGVLFTVIGVTTNTFTFNAGISTIAHDYVSGGIVKKVPTAQRVLRYTDDSTDNSYDFRVTGLGGTDQFTIVSSASTISHFYVQSGIVSFRSFEPFLLTVKEVQTDKFSGFYPGQFVKFDDISNQFNGFRQRFTLRAFIGGQSQTINLKTPIGSDLDITNNIFIYLNDVLQLPGEAYEFKGSRIIFTEAPKPNFSCTILYYRGSSVDVEEIVPPSTLKSGDTIIIKENKKDPVDIDQFGRVIKNVSISDQFDTFTYDSLGISTDPTKERPLVWIKQKSDKIINGAISSKARPDLKSNIRPQARVIKDINLNDGEIYVDNVYPIFSDVDGLVENLRDFIIVEDRVIEQAIAEAQVSSSSSISNINITFGGVEYQNVTSPTVFVSSSAISEKDALFNWQGSVGISPSYQLNSISYGNVFVGVGSTQSLVISPDGKTWQSSIIGLTTSSDLKSIISHKNGQQDIYVSVGSSATIIRSIGAGNSISAWSNIPLREERSVPGFGLISNVDSSYTGTLNDVVYSPSYDSYVTVGTAGSIFVGTGIGTNSFISKTSSTLTSLNSVSFSFNTSINSGYFVAVGGNGVILTSNSGQIWDIVPVITTQTLNKVIFAEGHFIIVGNNGTVIKSVNQNQYQLISTNIGVNFVNINYDYGVYAALDDLGNLYYSLNLSDWNLRSTNQSNILKDLIFVNSLGVDGRYVTIGFGGTSVYAEPVLNRATAFASVSGGIVTSINITNGGFGYSSSNLPQVLVESDTYDKELIRSFKVIGDHGIIVGVNTFITGTPGIGTTTPKIEFVLKTETYDNTTLGIGYSSLNVFGITNSQLQKGDYFVITDSNVTVGHAITGITTSLGGMTNYPASKVGTARSFIDGVYRVENVTAPILGIVTVTCNLAPGPFGNFVQVYQRGSDNSGINTSNFYGRYSWGKLFDYQNRILDNPKSFTANTDNGIIGLSTTPKVIRTRSLLSN